MCFQKSYSHFLRITPYIVCFRVFSLDIVFFEYLCNRAWNKCTRNDSFKRNPYYVGLVDLLFFVGL